MRAMATAPACERASDWTCPICLEMLCKPTVLPCGHTLCYWDAHRSMSAFDVSACPVCRTPFAHFPQICESLHAHLGRSFPREYARRLRDTFEEELRECDGRGAHSPDPPASLVLTGHPPGLDVSRETLVATLEKQPPASATATADANEDDPPAHLLCVFTDETENAPPGASPAEPPPRAAHLLHDPVVLTCGHAACAGCSRAARSCPACGAPIRGAEPPSVCVRLRDVVRATFGDAAKSRADAREEARRRLRSHGDENGEKAAGEEGEGEKAAAGEGDDREEGEGAAFSASAPDDDPASFTHVAVGCDACGAYPIVGRRFRCLDCPEAMGFDLCGTCHARTGEGRVSAVMTGRFAQAHAPAHRMEEVRPRPTVLHVLRRAHPELSHAQIFDLLQMSVEGGEEGGEEGEREEEDAGEEGEEGNGDPRR